MEEKDCKKEPAKKTKNWGNGGGLYRGVKASVKSLNIIILVLIIALVAVVVYLSSTSSYTISYEVNGGETLTQEQHKYGDALEVKEPMKTGYTFAGWYQDQDLTKVWNTKEDSVKDNMTLYAKWTPSTIHVLFDLSGGTVGGQSEISGKDIKFHEAYGTLPTPVKDGFVFIGWKYNGGYIQEDSIVSMNGEHTLTAIFE